MGRLRRLARMAVARGVDAYGRRVLRRHESWPSPSLWDMTVNAQGHLCVAGQSLVTLAEACGTPLHVVDQSRLERNLRGFLDAFRRQYERVEVAYSYKTNPLPGVLRRLHGWGAWAEVISHFELWLALKLGVPADRIIFNGPGKTRESLDLAVSRNVAAINIDGLGEIEVIEDLAARYGVRQSVGLRVIASVGWSEQFGLPIANGVAGEAARRLGECSHVALAGLHLHLGTGIAEIATYTTAIRELAAFAVRLRRERGTRLGFLDLGGGFAATTVQKFSPVDEILLHHGLPAWPPDLGGEPMAERHAGQIVAALDDVLALEGPRPLLIFEPGRAITGSAQMLLLSVTGRKDLGREVPALILDGGRNVAMPPSWQYHALLPASRAGSPGERYYDVFGPLCHPGDLLFRARWLPDVQPGDLLSVMDAGAYFVPNQMNFSNPRPAAVMVSREGWEVIRTRESFDDIVRLDVAADPCRQRP
jgi:diaminopimelate decarboxylase